MTLLNEPTVSILLTHLHLDHIQGLMFFPPCFRAGFEDHDLGAGLAGGLTGGPDRTLHLGAALAGRGARASLRRSPSATRPRPSGRSARPRSGPRRSPTAAPPSATASPTARRPSATSPTTSRRWAPRWPTSTPEWISGLRPRPRRRPPDPRLPVHRRGVPRARRLGPFAVSDTLTFAARTAAKRVLLFHHDPLHMDDFLDGLATSAGQPVRRGRWRRSRRGDGDGGRLSSRWTSGPPRQARHRPPVQRPSRKSRQPDKDGPAGRP